MDWKAVGQSLLDQADSLDYQEGRPTGRGSVIRALGKAIIVGFEQGTDVEDR